MILLYRQGTIEIYIDKTSDTYQFFDDENSFVLKFSSFMTDKIIKCLKEMYDKYVINSKDYNIDVYRFISNEAKELNKIAIYHNNIFIGKALEYSEIIQDVCEYLDTKNITRENIKDKNIGYIIRLYNKVVKTKGARNEKSSSRKN